MISRADGTSVIRRNWTELVKPERLERAASSTDRYGKFVCEPLERGFATTLGNALRRILLSSLQGAAIAAVKIRGIQHEFTTMPGLIEDVTDVILNLKGIKFRMTTDEPQRVVLKASQRGPVHASALQETTYVQVLNPDHYIATLSEDIELEIELEIRVGKGYLPAEMHEGLETEIGVILLDSSFSPVKKVAYHVEQARVGQMTNYDKLILEVWTDGSVLPEDALAYSAKILKDQLTIFINFDETCEGDDSSYKGKRQEINPSLFKSIEDLELPVRASNCLKSAGIHLVGELVQKNESEMLKTKNFGRKSLEDIRRVIEGMDLEFGMKIDNFEKLYQEWLKRQEEDEA